MLKQTTLCTGSMLQIVGREMIRFQVPRRDTDEEDCASSVIVAMFFVEFVSVEENVVGEMHGPILRTAVCPPCCFVSWPSSSTMSVAKVLF